MTYVFECPECGLHYEKEETVEACAEHCLTHDACDLELARMSAEARDATRDVRG